MYVYMRVCEGMWRRKRIIVKCYCCTIVYFFISYKINKPKCIFFFLKNILIWLFLFCIFFLSLIEVGIRTIASDNRNKKNEAIIERFVVITTCVHVCVVRACVCTILLWGGSAAKDSIDRANWPKATQKSKEELKTNHHQLLPSSFFLFCLSYCFTTYDRVKRKEQRLRITCVRV